MSPHAAAPSSPPPIVEPAPGEGGLVIYRASRLEALLDPFRRLLDATWPDDPLQAQTVIAAHPGMKQWLTGALAKRMGRQGVIANLEVMLPSAWIDRLAQSRLGAHAVALPRWQRQHLRWNLYQWLGDTAAVPGLDDPRIARFLDAGLDDAERSRRRYQLADRLARLYSQYLVYRPDWLDAWARGQHRYATAASADAQLAVTESRLLAPLWRRAVREIGSHRAEVVAELIARLQREAGQGEARVSVLHVFGLSHLAPAELAVLRAYAEQALVALYLPDPCRDYWGVLGEGAAADWRRTEDSLIAAAEGGDWWRPARHELLARWGRLGQHFFAALLDGDVREDIRHWRDDASPAPANRLERVQESIRQLDESLIVPCAGLDEEMADPSLRIHLAHTPQRELEILRDAMLDARASGIEPGEMLVMAPDIRRYLPLIPALFGHPGDPREPLPYHTADAPVAQAHPLFAAFLRLLALPASRLGAAEVLDLLSMPELARRFGLDAGALDALAELLAESRVAWSLDAAHRGGFGVPALAEHGFAWALDRMIAGYLASDESGEAAQAMHLPDGTELLPLPGLHGEHAAALGALDALLRQVRRLLTRSTQTLPASEWAGYFEELAEAVLRIDREARPARDAWDALKRIIASLRTETAAAGVDPDLHFAVAAERLRSALASAPARQPFLLGGATFSGMVPQRAIPFRFIAVLGLDDGEFPRHVDDGGLDLMARLRRQGDRDQRFDDRYLFLETLMSARQRLHLSYVGEGVRDGQPRNPAAPLAELAAVLARADAAAGEALATAAPWRVRHPLQPFDARYVDGRDPRLYTYHAGHAALRAATPAMPAAVPAPEAPMPDSLALSALKDYWRDPARHLLQRRLRLSLEALDDERLPMNEPIEPHLPRFDSVARRLLFEGALADPAWHPEHAPDWLRLDGRMPAAGAGEEAWRHERELTRLLADALRAQGAVGESLERQRLPIDLSLDLDGRPLRLHGQVDGLLAHPRGGLQLLHLALPRQDANTGRWQDAALDFGKRAAAFLDWLAARLTLPADLPLRYTLSTRKRDAWADALDTADERYRTGDLPRAALEARLGRLIGWWCAAEAHPLRYFPRTSWAAWRAMQAEDATEASIARAARAAWLSGWQRTGERDYAPGYAALLAGDETWAAGSPALRELMDFARELAAALEPGLEPHRPPAGEAGR
ncbi:exodeoxyribonuclease V subunit gamma [Lysobacter pythonis]|uniref:RecBCD enzyme subunit RecC n=1 Tax=Solilutibacter pythonis TaxID=2483112 RepID=A0A3M2HL09_9GAMM|nr:exodeoxyribonuclease V subunit gamma [Lysobacter pythonis]RMH87622.1 exodeoxyribonuclease V subunit gamma [Lysobacter pythonis]